MGKKTIIVYGSTTGNTEMVAEQIGQQLTEKGAEVTVKNVANTNVDDLNTGWDIVLLGASTWGDSDIEFQEDFDSFYEELDKAKLKDIKVGVFGCGDSSYEHFCGAVDLLEDKMTVLGAKLINEPLRIDGEPSDADGDINDWAGEIAAAI